MLETGYNDDAISQELGFSVDVVATWRADAGLDIVDDSMYDSTFQ